MAIDTARKRVSMMNMATDSGSNLMLNFVPDGTVAIDDRQTMLDCYAGIAFDNPVAPSGPIAGTLALTGVGI